MTSNFVSSGKDSSFLYYRLFLPVYYQLAKEPEKSTSIFLQPSGKMTRSPVLKVSSLLQLSKTSNKRRLPEPVPRTDSGGGNESFDTHRVILFRVLLFLYSPSKVQQYLETCKKIGEKVLEKVTGKGRMFISARTI